MCIYELRERFKGDTQHNTRKREHKLLIEAFGYMRRVSMRQISLAPLYILHVYNTYLHSLLPVCLQSLFPFSLSLSFSCLLRRPSFHVPSTFIFIAEITRNAPETQSSNKVVKKAPLSCSNLNTPPPRHCCLCSQRRSLFGPYFLYTRHLLHPGKGVAPYVCLRVLY